MKLQEFLTPAVTCRPETSLLEAAGSMETENVGSIVVLDHVGQVVGIVTDRDLALRGLGRERLPSTPVAEVMTRDVVLIREDADLFDASQQMASAECRRLPVVGLDGTLRGVVTLDDLMVIFAHQTDSLANAVAAEIAVR